MELFLPVWLMAVGVLCTGVILGMGSLVLLIPIIMRWAARKEHNMQVEVRKSDREARVRAVQERYNEAIKSGEKENSSE